jgi:S-formylglutathione hydrolase FrmB
MKWLTVLLCCLMFSTANAATVDTVSIYSPSMHRAARCIVVVPKSAQNNTRFPTVYLLHGYSGDYGNWLKKVPNIINYADEYQELIVCPDGGYSSWYLDSPIDTSMRYETYISQEVPAYIDAHYPTIANRAARAITGLSMGGYGALFIGFRHASFFGACGSMSGGVDLHASIGKFDVDKRIGDTAHYADSWTRFSLPYIIRAYPKDSLALIFDCGTEDFFYGVNHALHEEMLQLKIPHDYTERPGGHTWFYWSNAVQFQLLYFKNYFEKTRP